MAPQQPGATQTKTLKPRWASSQRGWLPLSTPGLQILVLILRISPQPVRLPCTGSEPCQEGGHRDLCPCWWWWHLYFSPGLPGSPLQSWPALEVGAAGAAGRPWAGMEDLRVPGKPNPSAPRICPGGTLPRAQWGDGGLCPRGCTHPPGAGSAPGCPRPRGPRADPATKMAPQRPRRALCSLRTSMPYWQGAGNVLLGGRRVALGRGDHPTWGQLCTSPTPCSSLQLARNRSKAEDYLHQSQPYLQSPQEPLRREAVRFIGEPPAPGSLPLPRVPMSWHRTCGAPLHPLPPLPAQVWPAGGSSIPSTMLHPGVSPPRWLCGQAGWVAGSPMGGGVPDGWWVPRWAATSPTDSGVPHTLCPPRAHRTADE